MQALAARLRELRRLAGNPGYRELARRSGFSLAALANAAGGRQMPSLAVTMAFVRACGGDPVEWQTHWQQAAAERAASQAREDAGKPPYRGLMGYRVDDAEWFFGRDRLVRQLATMLEKQRFVAVFGASGSGKSSLLRAGLIPAMSRAGFTPVVTTPGDVTPSGVLLVVDQFEELFTLCADPVERARFVDRLAGLVASGDGATRVVLGVRADFYARCTELPVLARLLAGANVPVGPLDADELRQVVTEPARQAGLSVERALVTKILADAAGQPGALPLVSHALQETWRQRRGDVLTVAGYEAAGGVAGAIAQTAETVYQRFDVGQRATARQVLTRLITLGDGTDDTRRRAARSEVDLPDATKVLHELAAARLIVLDRDTVDIAHEALIRAWPRLHAWLHTDRETLRLHRRLTEDARVWESLGRDAGALYRGARLSAWHDRDTGGLNPLERTFLDASRDLAQSEDLVAQARRQAQRDPSLAKALARKAYTMNQSVEAEMVLRQATADDRTRGIVAGRQGHATGVAYSPDGKRMASTGTDNTLRVWSADDVIVLDGWEDDTWSPVFSPDGQWVAAAGRDGTIRMWPGDGTGAVTLFRGHAAGVSGIAFSPDSQRLASAGDDGTVRIWPVDGPGAPVVLRGHEGRVWGVAFSPDGRHVASSGYSDRTVRVWDLSGAVPPIVLRGHDSPITTVEFSPDGMRLATASLDGTARVWPVGGEGESVVLRGHQGTVNAVAFSPDGRWLATTGADSTVRVWNPAQSNPLVLHGHRGNVWDAAFSPDGSELATAAEDGTVRIWSPWGVGSVLLHGHEGAVWSAVFAADGRRVVSGGADATIRVWSADGQGTAMVLRGHEQEVLGLTVSRDGGRLASGGRDGTVRVWDLNRPGHPTVLCGHENAVWIAALAPDGSRVASASRDGTLRIWDLAGGSPPLVRRADRVQIRHVAFGPDGQRVATAGADGTVRVWDVTGAAEPLILRGHQGLVWAVAFSPDGRRLASSGSDGTVRIWPLATGETPMVLEGHDGFAWHVAFSPDGQWVASAGQDDTVRVWSGTRTGPPITYSGFVASVEHVAFGPDSRHLVTAHGDGTVRVWRCDALTVV